MEFEIISEVVELDKFIKFNIKESGHYLSFDEVLGLLENDESFRTKFVDTLNSVPFKAYNIEFPPIKIENINRSFEFVIVNAPALLSQETNSADFKEHFNSDELTAVFENLNGDAILISPTPEGDKDFGHLNNFLKNASAQKIADFLVALAEITESNLKNEEPVWLNTSGLGVAWLHFRIDDAPKYFQYEPYKSS